MLARRFQWILFLACLMQPAAIMADVAHWDLPTPYAEGEYQTQVVQEFADRVRDATHGSLDIRVHAAGSLYRHAEIFRAVRSGQVPLGQVLMGLLGNRDPVFKVDNVPFLADDFPAALKLWHLTRPDVEEALERQGLILLFAVPWPPQGIYSRGTLKSVADLRGTRMRVYSPLAAQLALALGASPVDVESTEIPQAFSTGMVDVMITSASTGVSSQAWDFVRHYTDTRAWIPKNMVFINRGRLRALPGDQQAAILAAAARAEARGWELARTRSAAQLRTLARHGMLVTVPGKRLRQGLQSIGTRLAQDWAREAGDRGQRILDAMRQ